MRLPGFVKPRRVRFPFAELTAARLAKLARSPSYRAPRVEDLHDPDTFRPPEMPPMPAAERALLDAVLADPDADEPRRAYAAWVEQQNNAPSGRTAPRERAEAEPMSALGPLTRGRSPDFGPWGAKDLVVRRGFVEGMSLSGRAFISAGDTLMRLTPLRDVRLVAVQPFVGELARCPHLARLRRLDLTGNRIGPSGIRELLCSGYARGLVELGLSGNALGGNAAGELRDLVWPARLEALELADNRLDPDDLEAITASRLDHITTLDVSQNPLGRDGAGILARSGLTSRLKRLSLTRCGLGPDGADALFSTGTRSSLRELDLRSNAIGPTGAVALAEDTSLTNLSALDLGFNDIEDAGAGVLAAADALASLVALNLAGNRLTAAGAEALAASGVFGAVEHLNLSVNPLGDAGAVAVVRGEAFASLIHLDLENCAITDAGVRRLAASGALGGLRSLSLAWNPFGDDGVKALAACPDLAGLRALDLTGTRFGFAGAVALAESNALANLHTLTLGDNHRLPADAVALLRGRYNTPPQRGFA